MKQRFLLHLDGDLGCGHDIGMTSWKLHLDGGKQIFSTQAWLRHEFRAFLYAPEISGMLATLHVATLPRALECLPRYMLLCCVDELQTIHPKSFGCQAQRSHFICQNVAMALRTRTCSRRLQTCCTSSNEKKNASFCPIEMKQKIVLYCGKNKISPKNTQIWTSKFVTFSMTQIVTSLW